LSHAHRHVSLRTATRRVVAMLILCSFFSAPATQILDEQVADRTLSRCPSCESSHIGAFIRCKCKIRSALLPRFRDWCSGSGLKVLSLLVNTKRKPKSGASIVTRGRCDLPIQLRSSRAANISHLGEVGFYRLQSRQCQSSRWWWQNNFSLLLDALNNFFSLLR